MSRLTKSIAQLLPAMRISFALTLLTVCIVLGAYVLGFTPNEDKFQLESRKNISESLAIQFSVLDPLVDINKTRKLVHYIVNRNEDILSMGLRIKTGQLIFQTTEHEALWQGHDSSKSTSSHVIVPLFSQGKPWGNLEVIFKPLKSDSILGFFEQTIFKTIIYILLIGFFVYMVFMLRTLRQLDPSSVIPERVSAAFDSLSEGVIILDDNEQILLANKAFCEKTGLSSSALLGSKISHLDWHFISTKKSGLEYPWLQVMTNGKSSIGAQLTINSADDKIIKYAISASPISGVDDTPAGVLVTLADITELEQRNTDLESIVKHLKNAQNQVKEQNKELSYLAARDPMTGCLNRRSFSEQFETLFNYAREFDTELTCLMLDLDHFKLVNDNYGHAMGDEVIKALAELLKINMRRNDLVGRYGGEEFCLVLPGMPIELAVTLAERIRLRVKDEIVKRIEGAPRVTVSIGIASIVDKPKDAEELNARADEALYLAKESGRNRVACWQPDSMPLQEITKEKATDNEINNPLSDSSNVSMLQGRIDELENIASKFSSELEYNNRHDALTGLPNQAFFLDRLQQAIDRGHRHGQVSAVLVIDIEMFSQVNATLGRSGGDHLLREVAKRLRSVTRKTDAVSRLVGDEFAVLLTDISQKEQLTWAIKRMLEVVNQTVMIDENTVYLACNVGISLYPNDSETVDVLLNNAMTAKKHCKKHKSELNYQFFDRQMQEVSVKQLHLEKELHHAIKNDHWRLLYQPKLDIKRGNFIGAEALLRWDHPERGLLSPFEFINFAEQRGLIIPIGDWVIEESCRQLKAWIDADIHDFKIAINLSSIQLMQEDIVSKILSALERHNVPPRLLEVEITESILMENIETAIASLQRLHARGILIAIDDFGTGYSSLSYLKNLPIDTLKIDRAFIKDICHDKNDQKIVKTLINMAHSMDISVVAEGVEEKEQYDLLEKSDCDQIQGYLLSKPLEAESLEAMLENQLPRFKVG